MMTPGPLAGFALATLASALLTATWIVVARRGQVMDVPGARRLHLHPTPRGGGIGIGVVMAFCFAGGDPLLASGIVAFAAAGLVDDLVSPPAWLKFLMQLFAGCLVVASFSPGLPLAVLLVAAVGYTVNAFNFMDGSNGLVAMQGLVLGIALALWPAPDNGDALWAWSLAGACLGFLPFNLPRARVFLGDIGSHAIGAVVATLMVLHVLRGTLPVPAALLMMTPILLDTGLTLARRASAGKAVWKAHREHLYQYAVRSGYSHLQVCLAYAAWTLVCVLMALLGVKLRSSLVMWTLLILNWTLGTAIYGLLRRRWLRTRRQGVV